MSSKNSLQEFCIKNNHSPPSYETKRIGGSPHDPQWLSIVTVVMCPVENKSGQSISVPGEVCTSKTEAEKSAAILMLKGIVKDDAEDITVTAQSTADDRDSSAENSMAVLIDVENMPNMIFSAVTLKQKYPKANIKIFACLGQHHHSSGKNFGKNVTKVLVPTTRKDGVDTFIQMFVGKLLVQSSSFKSYAIVTRDHFGHALAELIESNVIGGGDIVTPDDTQSRKRASVITTQEQLYTFFVENPL